MVSPKIDIFSKEYANSAADRIVANAIKDSRGGYAWHSTLHGDVDRVPNFEGGTAGILQFLINCGIVFNGTDFADSVNEVIEIAAEILVGEQESKVAGRIGVWPIAYERVKPEKVAPDFGYAIGASGIAATLIQLYQYKNKQIAFGRYIDDPYPTNVTLK